MSPPEESLHCQESADAAAYVLGALDEPESYSEHLATCRVCQAEVARLQPVVDNLPATVAPQSAPEGLRGRVLSVVRAEAELLRVAGQEADEPPRRGSRWRRPRGAVLAWSALAASVAAVLAIALTGGSSQQTRVTSAHVTVVGAHASLRQVGGHSELVLAGMPQPPQGRIYQVWLSRGAAPQPTDALFGVTSRGSGAVAVPGSLHGVKEVLVTSEPLGGSSHPTSTPLIRVTVG
jgi:Anti-sigma-K factor rskA